jgi:hypothetical protein
MTGLLQLFIRRSDKYPKTAKIESLGQNPLFYKALTPDKKILKIKRRKWD